MSGARGAERDAIIRADPRWRRKAVVVAVVAGAALMVGLLWGLPALQRWVVADVGAGRITRGRIVCLAFGGIIVALAVAVVFSGRRIARFGRDAVTVGRFPPPGMPVWRDAQAVTGRPAVILGQVYRGLGATMMGLGLVLLGLGAYAVVLLWP